jgi:hypothetical protein
MGYDGSRGSAHDVSDINVIVVASIVALFSVGFISIGIGSH